MSFFQQVFQDSQPRVVGNESVSSESSVEHQIDSPTPESFGPPQVVETLAVSAPMTVETQTPIESAHPPESPLPVANDQVDPPASTDSTFQMDAPNQETVELLASSQVELGSSQDVLDSTQLGEAIDQLESDSVPAEPSTWPEGEPIEIADFEVMPGQAHSEIKSQDQVDNEHRPTVGPDEDHDISAKTIVSSSLKPCDDHGELNFQVEHVPSRDDANHGNPVLAQSIQPTHGSQFESSEKTTEMVEVDQSNSSFSEWPESLIEHESDTSPASSLNEFKSIVRDLESVQARAKVAPVHSRNSMPTTNYQPSSVPRVQIRQIDIVVQAAAPSKPQSQSTPVNSGQAPWYLRTI